MGLTMAVGLLGNSSILYLHKIISRGGSSTSTFRGPWYPKGRRWSPLTRTNFVDKNSSISNMLTATHQKLQKSYKGDTTHHHVV